MSKELITETKTVEVKKEERTWCADKTIPIKDVPMLVPDSLEVLKE